MVIKKNISIILFSIITARCSVIAAANPTSGTYNCSLPFSANVQLTEPILSRFDVLLVIRDIISKRDDEQLAQFVVHSHFYNHPKVQQETEGQEVAQVSAIFENENVSFFLLVLFLHLYAFFISFSKRESMFVSFSWRV